MAGVAVPVLDHEGMAVAAISVGTLSERLNKERLATIVGPLNNEAASVGEHLNPFDPMLRRPAQVLGGAPLERPRQDSVPSRA